MSKKISNEQIGLFCMELSLLLHAGVTTGDALVLLAEEGEEKELLSALSEQVDSGVPLSAALEESGIFLLKGAVKDVAAGLGCSQASVYRYLSQIKK